ncbi:MAG: hypothetical protein L6R40_004600 [Gallowayella cf. fulva]|nr:MAG: hypothetical protein L6R40_004600 [Xanthomendoza cf. fulva]
MPSISGDGSNGGSDDKDTKMNNEAGKELALVADPALPVVTTSNETSIAPGHDVSGSGDQLHEASKNLRDDKMLLDDEVEKRHVDALLGQMDVERRRAPQSEDVKVSKEK